MFKKMQIAVALWLLLISLPALTQPIVYVVRHGEKLDASRDTKLSPEGEARAVRLAQMLAASGISAIYTTEYQRTMQLAAPLARQLKITANVVPANDADGLEKKIAAHGSEQIVLVVGHSNTVPATIKRLGYTGEVKVEETDFDNLFVVVPRDKKEPALLRLKY